MRMSVLNVLLVGVGYVHLAATFLCAGEGRELPSVDAVIRGKAGRSEIVVTTTKRVAGAIHSITWNGKEFIDSFDHGRQLQSAANFDAGSHFIPETFNPTEAGSLSDEQGETSSSRLLHMVTTANGLQTTTQMAFWLRPGEKSLGKPAKNTTVVSNHLLTKRVRIGHRIGDKNYPHVIEYDVTFAIPISERHTIAQFEAVTGYMPSEFGKFWKYNKEAAALEPLSDGPGEQSFPLVFSTDDGGHAMGIYCPPQQRDYGRVGYGRFRFKAANVNKWNCVFRIRNDVAGIAPGEYAFRSFVIVGDLETVRDSMRALHESSAR
jgi:hypothetical protein